MDPELEASAGAGWLQVPRRLPMQHLGKLISQANGWRLRAFAPGAAEALAHHRPGNVR